MNSFLGLILSLVTLILIVAGGACLWYLSATTEFSRAPNPPAASQPR